MNTWPYLLYIIWTYTGAVMHRFSYSGDFLQHWSLMFKFSTDVKSFFKGKPGGHVVYLTTTSLFGIGLNVLES